jgi:hypothetical protein
MWCHGLPRRLFARLAVPANTAANIAAAAFYSDSRARRNADKENISG